MSRKFTTKPKTDLVTVSDLLSRCQAAARLAMRGKSYSTEDRRDCAADVLLAVLERLPAAKTGRKRKAGPAIPDAIPSGLAPSFGDLYGMACNRRRSLDRDRERDTRHHLAAAAETAFTPHLTTEDPEVRGTAHGARLTAVAMLRELGMIASRSEIALYTAAYAAARATAGLESREIAAELDISYGTLRNRLSAAAGLLPSATVYTAQDHGAAILPDSARGLKAARSRTESSDLGYRARDWRTRPKHDAPITCRTRKPNPRRTPADWTRDLPETTRARLAKAASISRERVSARGPAERRKVRGAAGIVR